ncbi:hypothetical protein [Halovivax limisalsi]|uniref:hypothetical protein n=1 Tax=Halovivax limisalsi TaxID=1453760 RepID=UPI001FFDE0BD|nr:hypothetical protein [Halovivax limisalsi]
MSPTPKYRHGGAISAEEATETSASDSLSDRVPVVGGLLAGVVSLLASLLIAGLTMGTLRRVASGWGTVEPMPAVWTEAVWLVLVNLGAEPHVGGVPVTEYSSGSGTVQFQAISLSAEPVYTVVVFGIVVGAGYAVAECVRTDSRVVRAAGSLLIVPAYLVLAPVLSLVSTWRLPTGGEQTLPESGQTVSISLVDATVYAGLLVPATLALFGGCLSVGCRVLREHRQPVRSPPHD